MAPTSRSVARRCKSVVAVLALTVAVWAVNTAPAQATHVAWYGSWGVLACSSGQVYATPPQPGFVGLNHLNYAKNYVYQWVNGGWSLYDVSNWLFAWDSDGLWYEYPSWTRVTWLSSSVPHGYYAVAQAILDYNSIAPHWEHGLATATGAPNAQYWCQA